MGYNFKCPYIQPSHFYALVASRSDHFAQHTVSHSRQSSCPAERNNQAIDAMALPPHSTLQHSYAENCCLQSPWQVATDGPLLNEFISLHLKLSMLITTSAGNNFQFNHLLSPLLMEFNHCRLSWKPWGGDYTLSTLLSEKQVNAVTKTAFYQLCLACMMAPYLHTADLATWIHAAVADCYNALYNALSKSTWKLQLTQNAVA